MSRVKVIAEVGLAHLGNFRLALTYIDACWSAGVDIVKFQLHHPAEGTTDEPFRVNPSPSRFHTRADYWRATGFTVDEWRELRHRAEDQRMGFMASVFCEEAIDVGLEFGLACWKVPSGQIANIGLLTRLSSLKHPIYASTGLGNMGEIRRAVEILSDTDLTLMHTTTEYPTLPHEWRLHLIESLQGHGAKVGFSDHSGMVAAGLAAVAQHDVAAVEVHVSLSEYIQTPDTDSSLSLSELLQLVQGVRAIEEARPRTMIEVDAWTRARSIYMPSLVAKVPIPKGTTIQLTHLIWRKMGRGPGMDWMQVIGRTATRDLGEGHFFTPEDVEAPCVVSA